MNQSSLVRAFWRKRLFAAAWVALVVAAPVAQSAQTLVTQTPGPQSLGAQQETSTPDRIANLVEKANTLLRTGQYEDAIAALREALGEAPSNLSITKALSGALLATGGYAEAEQLLLNATESEPRSAASVGLLLGRAQVEQGKLDAAKETLVGVIERGGSDELEGRLALAELFLEMGERETADDLLYSLITAYNVRSALSSSELAAVGRACQLLGRNDPQLFKDALKALDESAAADPNNLEPLVRVAELFLEKYDSTQARKSLQKALALNVHHPRALLAMARVQHFDGSPVAMELVQQSLKSNPSSVEARSFLARLKLELEDFAGAEEEARAALEVNARSLPALSVLTASHYLRGQTADFERVRDQVLAYNPIYADLYNDLADACVMNRLYQQARDFAAKAVALNPLSWRGFGLLGLNQLRLGEIEEGRKSLELAFEGDPYNVWNKNTLDLLDTYGQYQLSRKGHFELFIHSDEAEILTPYIGDLAERAYESLAERYQYRPPTPIRIEVYPSHEDFSVRTVGLAGLGALGVSFGRVLAIDSPSAREVGHFNWGSTLWHELTHTFTLAVTKHKIPRWLTEGLSVLEERRAQTGWGDDIRPEFLQAFVDGELLGLAEINNGFVRPSFPIQIALSYFQASLVCELIEDRFGFDKMRAILRGYADGKTTEELFATVLELDLEAFDELFFGTLEERYASALTSFEPQDKPDHGADQGEPGPEDEDPDEVAIAAPIPAPVPQPDREELERLAKARPDDFKAQLRWATKLFGEDELEAALPYLERAKQLFPEFVGGGNPYRLLAEAHRKRGDLRKSAEELRQLTALNELAYAEHRQLAELLGELGEASEQAEVLERSLYIYPLEPTLHGQLAEVYGELGNSEREIRELRAIVALKPPSRAQALYRLAAALSMAGERAQAKQEVLHALELAPSYSEAQDLLLELVDNELQDEPKESAGG